MCDDCMDRLYEQVAKVEAELHDLPPTHGIAWERRQIRKQGWRRIRDAIYSRTPYQIGQWLPSYYSSADNGGAVVHRDGSVSYADGTRGWVPGREPK